MADVSLNESDEVTIADSLGTNKLMVMTDGSINVNIATAGVVTGKSYVTSFAVNAATSAEIPLILWRNPSGSGKTIAVLDVIAAITNTNAAMEIYRFYFTPTVTSVGTSKPIYNSYIGGGYPASSILVYAAPTISANGSCIGAGISVAGTSGGLVYHREYSGTMLVAPGYDLLITGEPDGVNRNTWFTLRWNEV